MMALSHTVKQPYRTPAEFTEVNQHAANGALTRNVKKIQDASQQTLILVNCFFGGGKKRIKNGGRKNDKKKSKTLPSFWSLSSLGNKL